MSRRFLLKVIGGGAAWLSLNKLTPACAQVSSQAIEPLPSFTGPNANPYWGSAGTFVIHPQKLPLIQLTDRQSSLKRPVITSLLLLRQMLPFTCDGISMKFRINCAIIKYVDLR